MAIAPPLLGSKITLRNLEKIDALRSRAWSRNPRIDRYLRQYWGNASDEEETAFWQSNQKSPNQYHWAIDYNPTGEHIGNCNLEFDPPNEKATLGILIGIEKYHNQGLGTETIILLQNYAFSEKHINRLELSVNLENHRALHCYKKTGFTLEGTLRDYYKKNNRYLTVHIMSILHTEWKKLKTNKKI